MRGPTPIRFLNSLYTSPFPSQPVPSSPWLLMLLMAGQESSQGRVRRGWGLGEARQPHTTTTHTPSASPQADVWWKHQDTGTGLLLLLLRTFISALVVPKSLRNSNRNISSMYLVVHRKNFAGITPLRDWWKDFHWFWWALHQNVSPEESYFIWSLSLKAS